MTPQKPDPKRGGGLPYAFNARLSTVQYRYLVLEAERLDIGLATVVRNLIDQAIASTPDLTDEHGEGSIPLRSILALGDDDAFFTAADKAKRRD